MASPLADTSGEMAMSTLSIIRVRRIAAFTTALAVAGLFGVASPARADKDTAPGQQKKQSPPSSSSGSSGSSGSSAPSANDPGQAPAGNNGTVKINDSAVDDGPNNEPHVACTFWVNFYGYDAGTQSASMTFEPWAPTGGGSATTLSTSWTSAERTGGNQLDKAYGPVDLSAALAGITPHPQQGYHVKLTVHVTGSQGSDVKHKVFWIQPCETSAPPAVGSTEGGTTAPEVEGTHTEKSSNASVEAVSTTRALAAPVKTEVLGEVITRQPSNLARTGLGVTAMVLWALALLGLGILLVRASRTRHGNS
jgi:hypothetical protein